MAVTSVLYFCLTVIIHHFDTQIILPHAFNTQKFMQILYISMGDKLDINNGVTFVFQKQYQKFIFVSRHKYQLDCNHGTVFKNSQKLHWRMNRVP